MAQPPGGAGEAGPSVHTSSKDSVSDTGRSRDEKRKHIGKPAAYPAEWKSFSRYKADASAALIREADAYQAECRKRSKQYGLPIDGPRLRRAALAVADSATEAASLEGGRRARPLLAVAKAARNAASYGSGEESAAVYCELAERVQKVARRLTDATASMKGDPTAARTLAEQACSFAETMRVIAEARAKTDKAEELRAQAGRRAALMRDCGRTMAVAQCGACGEYAEGSGELVPMHCHARECPLCARHESGRNFHELRDRMKAVPKREGYAWRMIELTFQRNPRDERLHTVDSLHERIGLLFQVVEHTWDTYLKRSEGSALFAKVECAGTGHVHAHLLYYGPVVPKALLESIVRQVKLPSGIKHGFTWIENAQTDEEALAAEATKYVTKSHSPMAEDWLAGSPREVMNATLAARWEIATMRTALSRTYGTLRADLSVQPEEEPECEEEAGHDDSLDYCKHCGVVDEMRMVIVETEATVQAMHAKGMRALRRSRWEPKQKPKPPPLLVEMQGKHHGDVVVLTLRDFREPWRESEYMVASRAEVFGGFFDDVPGVVLPDTLAMLAQPAADGATWVLSIERRHRVRARLEQVVFDAAA